MKRSRLVILSLLIVSVLGVALFWFVSKHEIYSSNIENARSISYIYQDYLGKTYRGSIDEVHQVNEIREAIKGIDQSKPERKLRTEQRTSGFIITFSLFDEGKSEIRSYSINGAYLAVGQMDKKPVTIYSVGEEEMNTLRDYFRNLRDNS